MSWEIVNWEIKRCRSKRDAGERIECLKELFTRTQDGMVAFALGEELEACGNLEEALQYFERAEALFPLDRYKEKARAAASRVKSKILMKEERTEAMELLSPPIHKMGEVNLNEYDPQTTLIVVACSKKKVWDVDENAPEFVPARMAYQGDDFRSFLRWAEDNGLEQRGFRWLILSAKYGYIEPWHPISNYDVTFNDETTGPISDETLYRQVMCQTRWGKVPLRNFRTIICFGSEVYVNKVKNSFRDVGSNIIHASSVNVEGNLPSS